MTRSALPFAINPYGGERLPAAKRLGEDLALDQAICFQFAQLIGQHARRHVTGTAAQLVEARASVPQMIEDYRLPLPVDQARRRFDGAAGLQSRRD